MLNEPSNYRLHQFDNLRALIMWLGVVIHVGMLHMTSPTPQVLRDKSLSPLADIMVMFIHTFRLPLFFIISGFFVAMLIQKRGLVDTVKQRVLRLGLPLLIFAPLVFYFIAWLTLDYLALMQVDLASFDPRWIEESTNAAFNLGHLWFLYYLLLCHVCFLPFLIVLSSAKGSVLVKLRNCLTHPLSLLLYLPILAFMDSFSPHGMLGANGSLLPDIANILHHGIFFCFGYLLFADKARCLNHYERRWLPYTLLGMFFFILSLLAIHDLVGQAFNQEENFFVALCYNMASWCFCFSLLGLFGRYVGKFNGVLRYLSDSAYWVYIIHLPFVLALSYLFYPFDWPFVVKLLINVSLSSILALASYQLFVRNTWLGVVLNGRRLPAEPKFIQEKTADANA